MAKTNKDLEKDTKAYDKKNVTTTLQKVSYGVGYSLGQNLKNDND